MSADQIKEFYLTIPYYGLDSFIVEQAARECGAVLLAVKGYALKDYPGERDYIEGEASYVFHLNSPSYEEAYELVTEGLRRRMSALYQQKRQAARQIPEAG